jgi:hypothetical protein
MEWVQVGAKKSVSANIVEVFENVPAVHEIGCE